MAVPWRDTSAGDPAEEPAAGPAEDTRWLTENIPDDDPDRPSIKVPHVRSVKVRRVAGARTRRD
jgi:hypothetical protein